MEVLQNQEYDEDHRMPELLMAQIVKEYVGYMAGRVSRDHWVDSAIEKMVTLRKLEPLNEVYQLMLANIYLLGEKIEEAKWILENYNYNRFAIGKDPLTNCYYLYLTAKIRGDVNYEERVLDEVGKTYMRHQDSWWLLYMILNLDTRYKNPYKRLEVLEQQFEYGIHSVMFYLEAYLCYQEKPTLLKKLGTFEIQVLNFATKYRMMTKELALYISNFASQQKKYSDNLFRILERIYKMYDEPMILNTICTLLIKGNKTEKKYFFWYQKAVDSDLKIAQLYEYYMMTIDEDSAHGPLPKSLVLYFMHGNALDYKKAAYLYASLVIHEEQAGDLYLNYREQMVAFTWEQLMKRHITESLRTLYKRFCKEDEMSAERMEAMRDICYSYEVRTKVRGMKCVLVIEKDGSVRQRIPYDEKNGAIIYLYDKESRIVWESVEGRHYTDSIPYETKRLFYEPRFVDMCRKYAASTGFWNQEPEKEKPDYDKILAKGIDAFDDKDVFLVCSRRIREENYTEDDFLSYLAFEMFRRGQYDKVTLTYLAEYYCGAIGDMKRLWKVLKQYGVPSYKVSERIITQMVFAETLYKEEHIFEDYYLSDNVYFRLKQAYLAYVSREYIVYGRNLEKCVFEIIANECEEKEDLPDVCKIALLKYYSDKEYSEEMAAVLHQVIREMCEKQLYFSFYLKYPENWLREVQLYDKTMIEYHAKPGSKVAISYQIRKGESDNMNYQEEILLPAYEDTYIKSFILFGDESLRYYFTETNKDKVTVTEKSDYKPREVRPIGKFGRLNDMTSLKNEALAIAMKEFATEKQLAEDIFVAY